MTSNNLPTARTPQEILAGIKGNLAKVRTKASKTEVSHPIVEAFEKKALEKWEKPYRTEALGFSPSSPQNYDNRMMGHELWIAQIQACKARGVQRMDLLDRQRKIANRAIAEAQALAAQGASDADISAKLSEAESFIQEEKPQSPATYSKLQVAVDNADGALVAFRELKKPKNPRGPNKRTLKRTAEANG